MLLPRRVECPAQIPRRKSYVIALVKFLTGADEVPAESGPEVVEHPVSVRLRHAGVNVVAGVAELSDLLGQQLDALGRVTEDDALVDLLQERIDQRLSSRFNKIGLRFKRIVSRP